MSAGGKAAVAMQVLPLWPVWRGGGARRACGAAAALGWAGRTSAALGAVSRTWLWSEHGWAPGSQLAQ